MTRRSHVTFAFLGLSFALSCNSGSSTTNPFNGPVKDGQSECGAVVSGFALDDQVCSDCLHDKCAAPYQAAVASCSDNALDTCQKAHPNDPTGFCDCAVHLSDGCGTALGVVYACFDQLCTGVCDKGTGGTGGTGGAGGSGGVGGAGGTGGYGGSGAYGGYGGSGAYGGYGGSGAYGGYGGSGAYGGYGGAGGAVSCPFSSGSWECDDCINGNCSYECESCMYSPDCSGLLDCIMYCSDASCQDACIQQYPGGLDMLLKLLGQDGCIGTYCQGPCYGTGGSGGSGGYDGSGGYGGTGGGPSCGLTSSMPECDDCINGPCFDTCSACVNSQGCIDILMCGQNCYDDACWADCLAQYPGGAAAYEAFLGANGCLYQYCASACGG